MRKPLPKALDIDIDGGLTEEVTPHAGVALLVELGRRSGVLAAAGRALPAKRASKGVGQGGGGGAVLRLGGLRGGAGPRVERPREPAWPKYEGFRGSQPLLVSWAETNLILADEFRDGNVPAGRDLARLVDTAYESLPQREGGWQVRVRSDSAAYDQTVLDPWTARGWTVAVSADMTPQL